MTAEMNAKWQEKVDALTRERDELLSTIDTCTQHNVKLLLEWNDIRYQLIAAQLQIQKLKTVLQGCTEYRQGNPFYEQVVASSQSPTDALDRYRDEVLEEAAKEFDKGTRLFDQKVAELIRAMKGQ